LSNRRELLLAATLVVTLCNVAKACDDAITTTPLVDHNPLYYKQFEAIPARRKAVDLILLGDSLAEFWTVDDFSPLTAINLGDGGDTTQNVLWRLRLPDWSRLVARNVLVVVGTNNLAEDDAPCAITAGIARVITRAKELWPGAKILVLEIPPRGTNLEEFDDARHQVNEALRAIPGVISISVDQELICAERSRQSKNYRPGNLHFTPAGYAILMAHIKPLLR
jgi:lysophospholipase L1-like esterase